MPLSNHRRLLVPALLAAVLTLGWLAYAPGLTAGFSLDDKANLGQLRYVETGLDAVRFAFSGNAGPLGRPIALASFLPQAGRWDDGAQSFIAANVVLHLCNGLLLFCLFALLGQAAGLDRGRVPFAAVAAAAIWLFLPINAGATIAVVQRMTTLGAGFVAAGLCAYLLARRRLEVNPVGALVGMSAALVLFGTLAVFTKENGALLPAYALVLESTLLVAPAALATRRWRAWSAVFLWLPTLLIAGYLATRLPYAEAMVQKRGFTGVERLLTELRVLWDYLSRAVLPLPGRIVAYHDDYPVARSLADPLTLLATLGWIAVVSAAVRLRRTRPLFAFAALWFLAGHLLESTVLPLEIYFDHRNYLPLAGPVFALCAAAARLGERWHRPAAAAIAAWALALWIALFGLTSLWGRPADAARYWQLHAPGSVRAATNLASVQLEAGDIDTALTTIRTLVSAHPEHAYVLLQDLNIACLLDPGTDHSAQVRALAGLLPGVAATYTAGTMLSELLANATRVGCAGVGTDAIRQLAAALYSNPRYAGDASYGRFHHMLLAATYHRDGDLGRALAELDASAAAGGTSIELVARKATTLAAAGRRETALAAIREARDDAPLHPVKRYLWRRDLDELEQYVASIGSGLPETQSEPGPERVDEH